ncbi:MAG: riboflavin biosynthesis protein RibF [Clostridiaceae bacterium]|nr:riboflavin biosynthesis protein RibF [Clostridiaceae bacterium]
MILRIFDRPDADLPVVARGVALGFFDGVHRGHLDLIRTLVYRSSQLHITPAVFTFPVHPGAVLWPDQPLPGSLNTLQERLAAIAACGVSEIHLQSFDARFSAMEPEDFLDQIIAGRLSARLIVAGPDYRFGRQGLGNVTLLQRWAGERNIEVLIVGQVDMAGGKISSSRIRALVQEGDLAQAAGLLGRPYRIEGVVVAGRRLGHRMGFPTANLAVPAEKVCPAYGVYATRAHVDNRTYEAITNIGLRPTVNTTDPQPVIETYLYDTDMPLYGQAISVDFLERIRPEKRFESLLQLGAQVREDLETVRRWHHQAEQGYEWGRVGSIPIYYLPTERFAQAALHLVFQAQADERQSACYALLMRILTASCRRYPSRISLASALDNLYGATLDGNVERNGNLQTLFLSAEALISWTDGTSPFQETCRLLFDLLLDPLLDDDGLFDHDTVESERRNLLMELAARENDRGKYAYDRCLSLFCGGRIEGLSPSGRAGDIRSITREELGEAYRMLLSQVHLELYLGGRIKPEILEFCREGLERLPAGERPDLYPGLLPAPFMPGPVQEVQEYKAVEQARILLAYKGLPPYFSHQSIVASVLNSMLGGDVHSLLFDVVREKMGLAYQIYSMNQRYLSALLVMAGVAVPSAGAAVEAIKTQLGEIIAGRFEDTLLERSRSMLETAILSQSDDLTTLLVIQINGHLSGRLLGRDDSLALLHAVSREQVIALASQLELITTYILTASSAEAAPEA